MWENKDLVRNKERTRLIAGALLVILTLVLLIQSGFYVINCINGNIDLSDATYKILAMVGIWFICSTILVMCVDSKY